jgi:hypothetical protein
VTRFEPNRNFLDELRREAAVRDVVEGKASEALDAAKGVARSIRLTGAYERSLKVDGARLLTTDPAGHLIEWGSKNNPPHAPLRKAAEQVGAVYEDTGP